MIKRVGFEKYKVLKTLYNITVISASDKEAVVIIKR